MLPKRQSVAALITRLESAMSKYVRFTGSGFALATLIVVLLSVIGTSPVHAQAPPPDDAPPSLFPNDSATPPQSVGSSPAFVVGGPWTAEGPAPIYNGQVENVVPNDEVAGAVHTVAAHASDADILYLGAANGGVWKTTNATATSPSWTPLTDSYGSLSIGALEFDPTDVTNQTLLAGIGRYSSYSQHGGPRIGMLRTTSGGTGWALLSGGPSLVASNISGVAPRGSTIVVSSNTSDAFFCTEIGIHRSTDTGATFSQVTNGIPAGVAFDLAGDPSSTAVLYTNITFANTCSGSSNGIYKSTDTGLSWSKVSDAAMDALILDGTTNNVEIAVGSSGNVYVAIINNGALTGLYRSGNGGSTWTGMDLPQTNESGNVGVNPNPKPGSQGGIHFSIRADPSNANIVYIGGDRQPYANEGSGGPVSFPNSIGAFDYSGRLFRCDASLPLASQCVHLTHSNSMGASGGGTASSSAPHADSREMVFDAGGDIVEVDDGGIYRRTSPQNNTGDWFSLNGDLQVTEFHDIAYDSNANILIGGAQDTGTPQEISPGSGAWDSVTTADGGDVAVDERTLASINRSIRYSSYQYLAAFRKRTYLANNSVVGQSYPALTLTSSGTAPLTGSSGNMQFLTPVAVNAITPSRLVIVGKTSIYESMDQGATVSDIGAGPGYSSNQNAIAYGGKNGGVPNADVLYVGVGSDVMIRTSGAGSLTASAAFPAGNSVEDVVMDRKDWSHAFVAADPFAGGAADLVFETSDSGAAWTDITGNLATLGASDFRSIEYVASLAGDMLVLGTVSGSYVSFESDFSLWDILGTGLPNAIVYDLEFDATDNLLVAGLLGRGAWTLAGLATQSSSTTTTTTVTTTTLPTPTVCGTAPELSMNCRLADPSAAGKSSVLIKYASDPAKDQVKWKWNKGVTTGATDFKDPVDGTNLYRFCIYDSSSSPQPRLEADIPAGAGGVLCGSKPCWKTVGPSSAPKGFKYKDKAADPNGVTDLKMKAGVSGKAQVQVKGKGGLLNPPPTDVGQLVAPVTVQLLIDDGTIGCFQTTFSSGGIKKQNASIFKAKGP
jgi:hypothetical protein